MASMEEHVSCIVHAVLLECVIKGMAPAWTPALQDIMANSAN